MITKGLGGLAGDGIRKRSSVDHYSRANTAAFSRAAQRTRDRTGVRLPERRRLRLVERPAVAERDRLDWGALRLGAPLGGRWEVPLERHLCEAFSAGRAVARCSGDAAGETAQPA